VPERVADAQRLADLLKARHPAFRQFQPAAPDSHVVLHDERLQVQVTIQADSVDLTMPYFRESAGAMMNLTALCITVLKAEGFTAFDPQLGRVVEAADLSKALDSYGSIGGALPQMARGARKPWWKVW